MQIKKDKRKAKFITFGEPPRPRVMAHTSVDLPQPFGPTTTFRRGPNSTKVLPYTRKFTMRRRHTAPFAKSDLLLVEEEPPPDPVGCALLLGVLVLRLVITIVWL